MNKKRGKFLLLILIILQPSAALAGLSSGNYSAPSSSTGSAAGKTESANYSCTASSGGSPVGKSSSASYTSNAGGGAIIGAAATSESPVISNFKIDGHSIIDNDYIESGGTLTATVTDDVSVVTGLSSVEVDGSYTAFSALTGDSSYDAATGALTYAYSGLSDGDHTIGINAVDGNDNITLVQYTVKVDSGALKATEVYIYPNPFNPNRETGKIAYRLSKDGNTSIYIFNAIGQLVYKQNFTSGAEGAHAGYNEIDWAGTSSAGTVLANDIYFLRVVSDGKVIGKCKIAIIK